MTPARTLAARAVATAALLVAAVTAIRLAYENPDTAQVVAAGISACAFLTALTLLLSAALGYGLESGRARATARYEAGMRERLPLGPIGGGYRVKRDEPNVLYEEAGPWRPTEAATEAADDGGDVWALLAAHEAGVGAEGPYATASP